MYSIYTETIRSIIQQLLSSKKCFGDKRVDPSHLCKRC